MFSAALRKYRPLTLWFPGRLARTLHNGKHRLLQQQINIEASKFQTGSKLLVFQTGGRPSGILSFGWCSSGAISVHSHGVSAEAYVVVGKVRRPSGGNRSVCRRMVGIESVAGVPGVAGWLAYQTRQATLRSI